MKRAFLLFLIASACVTCYGQGAVTKLAKKYEANQPSWFWYKLGTEHPQNKAMQKAIKAKKPAMQIVAQGLGDLSSLRPMAKREAIRNKKYNELLRLIEEVTQVRSSYKMVDFFIVRDNEANACMYPEGTCKINTGLIENAKNTDEIIGVIAHEIAHYVLQHTMNDFWRTAKAVRRNQTWAEIGTGLAVGAYAYSQMNAAQYGVQQSNQAQQQMYNNITNTGLRIRQEIGLRTDVFTRLRYMRETEEEADEVAFWFLEKNGIDPICLISFFKRLDANTPSYLKSAKNSTKYSSHPDMPKRIQNIEKLYAKYHDPNFTPNSIIAKYEKEKAEYQADYEAGTLFVDKQGRFHMDRNCYWLDHTGLAFTTTVDKLTKEPEYCSCFEEEKQKEISIAVSSLQLPPMPQE